MARFQRIVIGIIVLLASVSAAPAGTAEGDTQPLPWQGMAADANVVRGTFTQEKHLAELDNPLVSTGRFVVARGRGLIWQVEQPVSTQLVITRNQLVERNDGRETMRIKAARQPGLAVVAAVLLAVFQGDMDRLQQFFDIEDRETDNGRTTITLSPATQGVREFVKQVQIEGDKHIERLRIDQPGGDYSVIDLKPAQSGNARLSADEQAAFER